MTTQWNSTDDDIESAYALAGTDDLGVLSTTRPVVEAGEWVWINRDRLDALVDQLHAFSQEKDLKDSAPAPVWYEQYHFFDGTVRTLNWLLVLDALNFCFWSEKDAPRWRIAYQGEILNGYWAEAASLKRGAEEGFPLWDARYLSSMSSEDLAHIFRGGFSFISRCRLLSQTGSASPQTRSDLRCRPVRSIWRQVVGRIDRPGPADHFRGL